MHVLDLREFEDQRRCDVGLLIGGLAYIELPRLAIMVGEALGTDAAFLAVFGDGGARKPLAGVSRGESSDKELGSYATRPVGCAICMWPSR